MRYLHEPVAMGTVTAAGNSGAIPNRSTSDVPSIEVLINGGTITGSGASLTPTLEGSIDGNNWFTIAVGSAVTAAAPKQRLAATAVNVPQVRVSWPLPAGTTPSFAPLTLDFVFNAGR